MKKLHFPRHSAFIFAFIFSVFIVACLKEQSNFSSKVDDKNILEFAKSQKPIINVLPVSSQTNSIGCRGFTDPDFQCEEKEVEMTIRVPEVGILPACDNVKVKFRATICKTPSGSIYVDYDTFEFQTCQNIMAMLYNNPFFSPQDVNNIEEQYNYIASLIAEYTFSANLASSIPNGSTIIEASFYTDLCYRARIVGLENQLFFEKEFCGTGCCRRHRTYTNNGSNNPITFTAPSFQNIGGCESEGNSLGVSCEKTCQQ